MHFHNLVRNILNNRIYITTLSCPFRESPLIVRPDLFIFSAVLLSSSAGNYFRQFSLPVEYIYVYFFLISIVVHETIKIYYYYFSLSRVFQTSDSWWFSTGVWMTASLLRFSELFKVFWPILMYFYRFQIETCNITAPNRTLCCYAPNIRF